MSQPSECGRQRTLNIVHAQTAAQQKSNGSYEARMSGKCGEWRDLFIMTLSLIHWVPVQDKGSKILCVKLGPMKITQSDPLHQEYLTIILGVLVIDNSCSCLYWGSVSDGGADSLTQSLTESFTHSLSKENAGEGAVCCQFTFQTLHATSQDGSSLELVTATTGIEGHPPLAPGQGWVVACTPTWV